MTSHIIQEIRRKEPNAEALIESVLFVADGPVAISRLGRLLNLPQASVDSLLRNLADQYQDRGLRLQRSGNDVQLTTAPECAAIVEEFLGLESSMRLSQAALEVLAIVAYLQPITRPRIESVRGVSSDSSLRTLLGLGLIEEAGRRDSPGRPILYCTTPDFLQYFGISSLDELPPSPMDEEE